MYGVPRGGRVMGRYSLVEECFRLALAEDRGSLIVALYEMPMPDLERLIEAAQLLDSEAVEAAELRDHAADLVEEAAASLDDYTLIGPVAVQGMEGCEHPMCRRAPGATSCMGYHCPYCGSPCSMMGHKCDAAQAILGEAEKIARERAAE